jgi:hypothetical protein
VGLGGVCFTWTGRRLFLRRLRFLVPKIAM